MKFSKITPILLMIVALCVTSCTNKKKQKKELEIKKAEIAHVVSDYVYPLPSSIELMDMLNDIEAAFIIGISNPPANAEKYETPEKQAINLGVYVMDLSYSAVYHRQKAAQDYLTACKNMVRDLHVDDFFQDDFASQISDNINNKDTLISLLSTTTQNVYSDFYKKGHTELASLMVAGAWTEAMYLTLIISENTPLNEKIINTIIFQHESLLKTIALLENSKESTTVSPILTALKGIKNTFDQEDPKSLTAEQFAQLKAQVTALRTLLVK